MADQNQAGIDPAEVAAVGGWSHDQALPEGFFHSMATAAGINPEVIEHPIQSLKNLAEGTKEEIENPAETAKTVGREVAGAVTNPDAQATAISRMKSPGVRNKVLGAEEYLASGIPLVGSNIVKSQERAAAGNLPGAAGTLVGTSAAMFSPETEGLNLEEVAAAGGRTLGEEAAATHPARRAVEASGGTFRGVNSAGLVEITLPRSMTDKLPIQDRFKDFVSVTMPESEVTPQSVKKAMDAKFVQMGGKAEQAEEINPHLNYAGAKYGREDGEKNYRDEKLYNDTTGLGKEYKKAWDKADNERWEKINAENKSLTGQEKPGNVSAEGKPSLYKKAADAFEPTGRELFGKVPENLGPQKRPGAEEVVESDLFDKAAKHYGLTTHIKKAGYISPDGRMLDFSDGQGARMLDHGDISEVGGLDRYDPRVDFVNKTGSMRVASGNGMVSIHFDADHPPTPEQLDRLHPWLQDEKHVTVDISAGDKEPYGSDTSYVGSAVGKANSLEDVKRLVRDARKMAGEKKATNQIQKLHEANPEK